MKSKTEYKKITNNLLRLQVLLTPPKLPRSTLHLTKQSKGSVPQLNFNLKIVIDGVSHTSSK